MFKLTVFYPAINNLTNPASDLARVQNTGEGNGYNIALFFLQIAIEKDNAAIRDFQAYPLWLAFRFVELDLLCKSDSPSLLIGKLQHSFSLELLDVLTNRGRRFQTNSSADLAI